MRQRIQKKLYSAFWANRLGGALAVAGHEIRQRESFQDSAFGPEGNPSASDGVKFSLKKFVPVVEQS